MRRQMGVENMGEANTFCDGKTTVANYLRRPKLLMVTAILPSQKTKKNTNMIFGDYLVTITKKRKKGIALSTLGIAITRIQKV